MAKVYSCIYNKPNIFKIACYRFFPGVNLITKEQWERIKQHPLLNDRFENGDLEWVDDKGPDDFQVDKDSPAQAKIAATESEEEQEKVEDSIDSSNYLSAFKTKKAIKVVTKTFNLLNLQEWQKNEDRKEVLDAIQKQIAMIEPENPLTKELPKNETE